MASVFEMPLEITTNTLRVGAPSALHFHKQIYAAIHLRQTKLAHGRMLAFLIDTRGILLTA